MKMSQCKEVLIKAAMARLRVLLVGPPGLGKTALVKAIRKELSDLLGYEVGLTILYASVSDPTDFKGFYCIVDGKPEILPFGELEKIYNAQTLHIVFLDDFGQGAPAVQAAAMSFMDRLKDNPNVCIIGATNRREDRAGVSGMLEPVKSRFDSIIHMDFDMNDWIMWALDAGLPLELIAFNKFRPNLMYDGKATADLVNMACPRTVESLGHLMQLNLPVELQFETYAGAVGDAYTAELMGYLPIWDKLPNIDTILTDPMNVPLPKMDDVFTYKDKDGKEHTGGHYAPSIYFAVCSALAKRANENTIPRILQFADRLPGEFAVVLVVDSVKNDQKIQNTKSYIAWQAKHAEMLM